MAQPFSYTIIRSSRKTAAIQVKSDGSVIVRCPKYMTQAAIDQLINDKSPWIQAHIQRFSQRAILPPFTPEELELLTQKAKAVIPNRTRILASKMHITYNHITIRCQRTRWGSCSSKGNLNFNCLLMLAPEEVLDYVIIHELCHRLEMNHSPAFWKTVAKFQPEYVKHRNWLKNEGNLLIQRLPK